MSVERSLLYHCTFSLDVLRTMRTRRGGPGIEEKSLDLQAFAYKDNDQNHALPSKDASAMPPVRKRKRGMPVSEATITAAESSAPRRSPRKASSSIKSPQRKPKREPGKRIHGSDGAIKVEPPPNWERMYSTCATMRKRVIAPVDTMGCESLAEEHRSPQDQRLQTLVSLMLSSQTKDTVTAAAMHNLQQNLPGGLNLESLLRVEPADLNRLIEKVGFHNNKTKFIKAVAVILRDKFNDDIPDTAEGLISLPGVGPKMAYLCLSAAWGRHEGIGVDVHVHRITNLWGWHKTSTPEQTRAELEAWLPKEKWHEINHLLVGLGQTVCLPMGRRCGECDLSKENLCPSAVAVSPAKKRIRKQVDMKSEEEEGLQAEQVHLQEDHIEVKAEADVEEEGRVEIQALPGAAANRQ